MTRARTECSMARCCDCGKTFHRDIDETWKTRCVSCFVKSKKREEADQQWQVRAIHAERNLAIAENQVEELEQEINQFQWKMDGLQSEIDKLQSEVFSLKMNHSGLDRELAEHLRTLLQLAHPDKHGGSVASTKATQWLLTVRNRLPCA